MDEIVDHKTDGHAVDKADATVVINGRQTQRKTTKGCWLLVRLKDHTTQCFKLKDIKESNPLDVAKYAVDNQDTSKC